MDMQHQKTIYLGGGCFWCTEAVFQEIKGILEVIPGYMGGTLPQPSYEAVCAGTTGHAEVVKIYYDDRIISTADILDVFFASHDPTTHNKQGNDIGSQYRSIIFYCEESQREEARNAIERVQNRTGVNVVTEIASATEFWAAEEYHYNYYRQNRNASYCRIIIDPKIDKLKKEHGDKIIEIYKE